MTSYVNPFTGQTISPSSVSYESLSISADTTLEWPINGNTGTPASSIIDVTATTTGLALILPPAAQVSTGQTVLVRNVGTNPFTVEDNNGGTIVSVTSGVAQFIFLTDNSTVAGTWASVVLGAGTSSANAGALAGYGLKAIGATLNQSYPVTSYYSNTAIPESARAELIVWASGVGTLTLPSAATVGTNWFCMIRNGGTGILTITPVGTDTIDGNSNQQLQLTESLVIVSNGVNWVTFGYGRSNSFAFTQLAKTIAAGTTTLSSVEGANIIQEYYSSGALTGNATVVLPSTVQLYSLSNFTTGPYTVTFKTAGTGTTQVVNQGQTAFVVCDGTNVYSTTSNTATSGTFTANVGSASSPSINFSGNLSTGFYLPASNTIGFTVNGTQAATLSSTGLYVANGISGGTF
jgi:hypothetical protein